jgi:preprotein translocase subunit YajC
MQALIVLTLSFGLLWVLFLLPQKRQVRAHQQLVADLNEGDEVVMTAGIHGRITHLGPEDARLEVAPGVELRIARQAVLRRVDPAPPIVSADGSHDAVEPLASLEGLGSLGSLEPRERTESTESLEENETPEPPTGDRV